MNSPIICLMSYKTVLSRVIKSGKHDRSYPESPGGTHGGPRALTNPGSVLDRKQELANGL